MGWYGIVNGTKSCLGDVPASLRQDPEFSKQFDAIVPDKYEAQILCEARIVAMYPTWQQLNILRTGNQDDINKMGAFIDACRAWSNTDNPDPRTLEQITP